MPMDAVSQTLGVKLETVRSCNYNSDTIEVENLPRS